MHNTQNVLTLRLAGQLICNRMYNFKVRGKLFWCLKLLNNEKCVELGKG